VLLHHADIGHHHATIDGFAHVVNQKKSTCGVRKNQGIGQRNSLQKVLVLWVEQRLLGQI
jgi:hypothetical protein